MLDCVHAITPGDHYSPHTGSAIPTVVDGLARAARDSGSTARQSVVLAAGTYPDRYPSAEVISYGLPEPMTRSGRYLDLAAGRIFGSRPQARGRLAPMLADQAAWTPSVVFAHNLVELVRLVDPGRHRSVLYAHNQLLRTYGRREARSALERADAIVCVSTFLADRVADRLPSDLRNRLFTVPNGVDSRTFHPTRRAADPTRLRVVFVGRMIPDKGPDVLLEAVGRLGRDDVRLTLVGSDGFDSSAALTSYERGLRARAGELGLDVTFCPFTDRLRLPALLREFDVLVAPSRWAEPWGLTITEGMATGLVVIASRTGGIPEAAGDAGLLVPPDDPDAIAQRLEELTDPDLRRRLARRSREHAEQHDWASAWRALSTVIDRR